MSEQSTKVAQGVQELISRIRDEGVHGAAVEGERIIEEARREAAVIVAKAKAETTELREKAHADIATQQSAAIEALQIAARDVALTLRTRVISAFERSMRRLVTLQMQDDDLLKNLILALAGQVGVEIEDQDIQIMLSEDRFSETEEGSAKERVHQIVLGLTATMLREGVELLPASDVHAGARVRLVGEDLELDFSDEAVSSMFLQRLLPRYTAILEGTD